MIHHSCDRCKRAMDADELRYVLRMEVQAAMDMGDADDDDRDHLLEIHEILERLADEESEDVGEEIYQRQRYDLCADCFRQFMENPLGAPAKHAHNLPFSAN